MGPPEGLRRVRGRDPGEDNRTATPLELLYDLTFAVAFGQASGAFAHELSQGAVAAGTRGHIVSAFAIVWAWTSYTWYASSFDPDDWLHRLLTMVQMVGAVVLALGFAPFFASLHEPRPDSALMVAGYVVMRVGMVAQWARVAHDDEDYRPTAARFAVAIFLVQIAWVILPLTHTSWAVFFGVAAALMAVEVATPAVLERRTGLPWHPHHLAERFSLLAIITLGEGVIGTVAALSETVAEQGGWSLDAVLVVIAGIVLTCGMWWSYFSVDFGRILSLRREIHVGFGAFHMVMLAALAATGSGLHVAGNVLGGEAAIDAATAIGTIAWPVFVFYLAIYGLYTYAVPEADLRHIVLVVLTLGILVGSVVLARGGVSPPLCLALLMTATVPTVVGYEWFGHAHQRDQLNDMARRRGGLDRVGRAPDPDHG